MDFWGLVFFKVTAKFTDSPAFVVCAKINLLRPSTVIFVSLTPDIVTSSMVFASVIATILSLKMVWLKVDFSCIDRGLTMVRYPVYIDIILSYYIKCFFYI